MRTDVYAQLSQLMEKVDVMMTDLGFADLSANERAVLLAMSAASSREIDGRPVCHTERARAHRLARQVSQPTFHRNLRRLIERGIVGKIAGLSAGEYIINEPIGPTAAVEPSRPASSGTLKQLSEFASLPTPEIGKPAR